MSKMSCFVPNCESSSGVPFPKDDTNRKKWIGSLNLAKSPPAESFVCLDHFKADDLNDSYDAGDGPFDRIKTRSVPDVVRIESEAENVEKKYKITKGEPETTCRICNVSGNLESSIHDSIDGKLTIMSAIVLCCYPVVVNKDDDLPQFICPACLKQLRDSHDFRSKCLETDEMWRRKRKLSEEQFAHLSKKIRRESTADDATTKDNIQSSKSDLPRLILFSQPPPLLLIAKTSPPFKYEEIERNLEEIHGGDSSSGIKDTEPRMKPEFKVRAAGAVKPNSRRFANIVNVPKGITVTQREAFESSTGVFSCVLTYGVQGSVFASSNDYLFAFGLLKGNTRFLHCVLPSCRARAEQTLLEDGSYADCMNVKVRHNHRAPTEQLCKKQMLFHVMRRRMQRDKTLNMRSIYEEVCQLEPEIRTLVPLRNVINEICRYQVSHRLPRFASFRDFYNRIEDEAFEKLHFTNGDRQFYQERFAADEEQSLAVVFCNTEIIAQVSHSKIMYVDASFRIDSNEDFKYQLVTALVWVEDSYYPILFALVNKKTREIFKKIFQHLHDVLAPSLRPHEIVTDYEANLYYALGETYLDSHIGGSVFYYTQNLYKKICSLNLSRDLEVNSSFRSVYHMLLMLPLLPVNTILDGLNNIEVQARDAGLSDLTRPVFDYVRTQWISNVTPELFCVHRLENRINENVIAPFKKLRDYLLLFKGKGNYWQFTVVLVVEKIIELESFLHGMYTNADRKSFGRDLSSFQKKNVVRAWQFIESHPKININSFFQKVLGYIKCMENQLWIWGFYRYFGDADDDLISASNFSIVPGEDAAEDDDGIMRFTEEFIDEPADEIEVCDPAIVMEAVIDHDGDVVLQTGDSTDSKQFEKAFLNYVEYE